MKALNIISIFLIILLFSSSAFALTANELQSIKELPVPVDTISEFNLLTRNVDTFFTNLISTKAELDRGEMVFEFNNPFSIPFDASMLTNYYEQSKNLNVESSEMFLLKQKEVITPIYEQILINKTCEYTPYNLNENITPKGELIIEKETPKNITYDCSYYENGKLTENKISYVDEWQPIKEIPAGKSTIKIVYHWQIKLGERAVDIMPSLIIPKSYTDLKISTWEYKATKWTWFNTSWSYKKEINLSGVPANTTNYQQRLVITKETGMNSNYSDLRFTNPTETTSLPYWIETSNASQAIVWLNVSIFNGTVAYLYYGDTSAVSTSNGSNVFLFFDDFNRADSASLGSNWQNVSAGNWSIISNQGYRNHEGTACGSDFAVALVGGVPLNFTDIITQATFNFTVFSGTDVYFGLTSRFLNNCGTDEGYHLVVHNAITNIQLLDGGVAWKTALTTTQALNENWNYELQINGTTINGKLWKVGTTKPTSWTITNTTSSRADGFIGISGQKGSAYHANAYFDNFFARTWIISEPTVTFGSELSGCVENLTNSTSVFVQNVSCLVSDLMNSSWNYTTFDVAACGFTVNVTHTFYVQNTSCNFCSFNPQYLAVGDWVNVSCVLGDLMNQSAETIQYDANYSSCYALTNLSSDLWNGGVNISTYLYQLNGICDFCTANLTNMSWSNWTFNFCMNTSYFNQSRSLVQYDVNGCVDEPNVTFYDYSYNSTACVNPSTVNINLGEIAIIFILALFALVLGLWGKQPVFLFVAALLFGVLSGMTWLSYGALLGVIFLVFTILSITLGLGMAWS
jgi:hypothetical protein